MNYLVIDLGGTFVKWCISNKEGDISYSNKFVTPTNNEHLLEEIDKLIMEYNPISIAFSSPGCIDEANDNIGGASAIEYIHGFKYKQYFKEKYNIEISIANDANCALYAELWKGVAKSYDNVISIVIGTGIGGSICFNKSIIDGNDNFAGEFGMALVQVDGELLRVSQVCSTFNMVTECSQYLNRETSGEEVIDLYDEDIKIKKIVDKYVLNTAILIFNLNVTINPQLFVIGGGISNNEKYINILTNKLEELLEQDKDAPAANVEVCEFKNDANLIGALYYNLNKLNLEV